MSVLYLARSRLAEYYGCMVRTSVSALLLFAACLVVPAYPQMQSTQATQPPLNEYRVLSVQGRGSQIYTCQRVGKGFQWVFQAPVARLFDENDREVGSHGDGPTWTYQDNSTVQGEVLAKAQPDPASVPWLLLKAVRPTGTGILAHIDMIRRSETHGGVAPATGCDADHLGALLRVPYTATYSFYSAHPGRAK